MRATRIPIGLFVALLALTSCDGPTVQEPLPPAVPVRYQLAFTRCYNSNVQDFCTRWGISVINSDGTNERSIHIFEDLIEGDGSLSWSPNGQKIAFNLYCLGGDSCRPQSQILLINADGTGLNWLTQLQDTVLFSPAWSPDGARIAATSGREYRWTSLYVMKADGSGITAVANTQGASSSSWSPDGNRIAFSSWDLINEADLKVVNADGSGLITVLTTHANFIDAPIWSPDGTKILFNQFTNGIGWLHKEIDLASGTIVTIASTGACPPSRSPDGSLIAVVEGGEIALLNSKGQALGKIKIEGGLWCQRLAWSPIPL